MEDLRPYIRKTKIIVTLGPASSSVGILKSLIFGGMDMARISDRFITDKQMVLDNLRTAVKETGVQVGVMLGLRESDMRISSLAPNEVTKLDEGQIIFLTTNKAYLPENQALFCNNTEFPQLVEPGDKLLIDFGKIVFTVLALECEIEGGRANGTEKREAGIKKHNIIYRLNSPPSMDEQTPTESAIQDPSKFGIPKPASTGSIPIKRIKRAPKPEKHKVIVKCRVEHECILASSKPLHISPHNGRPQPISCSNDVEDIKNIRWAVANDIDVVVFKQIREADDFVTYPNSEFRQFIGIQNRDNVKVSHELVSITDGCVIGRGMLALETSLSEVCRVQKEVTALCNEQAKPIIISTQLLESMCVNTVPSRSEVNDITNAVLDGCDALLLSGETAYGHHPLLALETCSKICVETEKSQEYYRVARIAMQGSALNLSIADDICYCAVQSVMRVKAVLIICISEKGVSVTGLAKYKPLCPILALTNSLRTLKYLRVVRGVIPALMQDIQSEFFPQALQKAIELRLVYPGDLVIYIGGDSDSFATGHTCTFRISKVLAN